MDDREREIRLRLKSDFGYYAPRCLKIRPKDGPQRAFDLNRSQRHLHDRLEAMLKRTGKVRVLVLKGRQIGISTYVAGRFYWKATHGKGIRTQILAHLDDASDNLFNLAKRYHDNCPPLVKPSTGAANAKELKFDLLDSGYKVATAGSKAVGRSDTIQMFHGCLAPDTPIVDGETGALRRMDSFRVGDRVRTHTGELAPISFISRQRKPAYAVTMKGMGQLPLTATGEHRFLTADGWRELAGLRSGDKLLFPVPAITDEARPWRFRLQDRARPQGGGTRETGPDYVEPGYELGRVMGLYLAEGCIVRQSKTKEPSAVAFVVHERELQRTLDWLEPISCLFTSISVDPRENSKAIKIVVYGRSFATFVLGICGELDSKRLPPGWRMSGARFARGLVHGYLSGDGCSSSREYDRRISVPSIRSAITIGMRDALAALGYGWASIGHHPGRLRYGKPCRPIWTLRLTGPGVDDMCSELGWEMPARRRHGDYGTIELRDGFAHVPIVDIEDVGEVDVMDFEVAHADHSYCTAHAATHNSEVAFWPNADDHFAGIMQAVADAQGTEVILESTANGIGNVFHTLWKRAERGDSEFEAIFIPWFWHEEYARAVSAEGWEPPGDWAEYERLHGLAREQTYWAYLKNRDLVFDSGGGSDRPAAKFKQEYPATAAEAFETSGENAFINPQDVLRARRNKVEGYGPIILGVDPARGGKDKTGIVDRQGRRIGGHICERVDFGENTMAIAARVVAIYRELQPLGLKKVCIDTTGLGGPIYDRLTELLPSDMLEPVNFGSQANNPTKYANRRSEMWDGLREWFQDVAGVQVPDSDDFQGDVCAPIRDRGATHFRSNGQLVLEEKDHIRDRLTISPDLGDGAALTFAPDMDAIYQEARNRGRQRNTRTHSAWAA